MSDEAPVHCPSTRHLRVDNAASLIALLDPLFGCFLDGDYFRGQADSKWPLLPSLFRDVAKEGHPLYGITYQNLEKYEANIFRNFLHGLDEHGQAIPGSEREALGEALHVLSGSVTSVRDEWPPDETIPGLALAQHYGVRTRLLDWTTRPLVAAYFAAHSCLAEQTPTAFAIWVAREYHREPDYEIHHRLKFRHLSKRENENLRAQGGVMLVYRQVRDILEPFKPVGFDFSTGSSFRQEDPRWVRFARINVPATEAPSVLRMLADRGVHGASLFPGLGGVARLTNERQWWPTDDDPRWQAAYSFFHEEQAILRRRLVTAVDVEGGGWVFP